MAMPTVALDVPSARVLADQASIIQDLQFVMDCSKRLLAELDGAAHGQSATFGWSSGVAIAYCLFPCSPGLSRVLAAWCF